MTDASEMPASTILIVDDNAQNLELLEAYLEDLPNVRTISATNGRDALDKVASQRPDLILLDVMMPKMSGFEVCKIIKSDPKTKDIAVIMVTALNEVGDVERGVEVGTNDFLTKPVNRTDLLARVKGLLLARHAPTERQREADYIEGLGRAAQQTPPNSP